MGRDIASQNAATSHFHNHEHIQQAESGRYRHKKNHPPRWPWRDCGQTSASAARLFSYHVSDHYLAASTPALFVAKPRSQASPTVLLRCAPRPRSGSPAPCAQLAGEDFPESAVFPTATSAQEQHLGTQFRPGRDRQPQKLNAPAVIRRIESNDRSSCAVLRMNGWRRNLQVAAGR